MLERPVIGAFRICGKTACGKFPAAQVILQAFAACALPRTGFVTAVAIILVLLQLAIHPIDSFKKIACGYARADLLC